MAYENITAEKQDGVGIVTLNRPQALNALCAALIAELEQALDDFEADDDVGAIVITGSEKAFAAGADIKEMQAKDYMDVYTRDFITKGWGRLSTCRKPTIAAVSGFALGGGCELAMMADIILAADTAKFGQPEITIGTIPGSGGTQRLTRYTNKSLAMLMCLTGEFIDADTALRAGLVAKVIPAGELMDEAMRIAGKIAGFSRPTVMMCKEAVNRSYETNLAEGILFERRVFHSTFSTEDQKEGMSAFAEKRKPQWKNR